MTGATVLQKNPESRLAIIVGAVHEGVALVSR